MTRSTTIMIPGTIFCLFGVFLGIHSLAFYVCSAIGISVMALGVGFWIYDRE